ncbi:oxidase [Sulfuriferula plumbiphila]|uniref:Oxidase n=1 Tax=Sulfuriferula plumbiphila TaxID=171865 RepID=A0A512L9I7_9PROT|nr:molybdopterin-dependent oxidoreductase [Sulfuriferula plumbiphila]BBP05960.1 oxidase [Sulfuriferula plumbiphila]GEP31112.1 oxidase [Sulfuriferula plumbiphila]
MPNRRTFLKNLSSGLMVMGSGVLLPRHAWADAFSISPPTLPDGDMAESILASLPGKNPLIKRTYRAPNYETPVEYFNQMFTPNDSFYVRWHLSGIPDKLSATDWRLKIGGDSVNTPIELTLDNLQNNYEHVEIVALNQCSGNRRGFFQPHVAGVEWGYGAMGNARWTGVRLKDVLNKAGIKKDALEVTLNGAEGPVIPQTPDFIKSLPLWKALDENTILAWEMNGEPLPHLNGFPVRLVVPGWTGTYWTKMITEINVINKPWDGFWMRIAYRIPIGKFAGIDRFVSQERPTDTMTPITEMVVNSLMTNIRNGQRFHLGQPVEVKGIAWDAGRGIRLVEVSTDGGYTWREATLGKDYGNYSWRQFSYGFRPTKKGRYDILARATNRAGSTQNFELIWNPAGYHHNVVQKVSVDVV